MKNLFALALVFTFSNTVLATGGTYCSVDNKDVKIEVSLTNGRIFGAPLVPGSTVEVTVKNGLKKGLSSHTFEKNEDNNEIPYWFNIGNDLKLGAYTEPQTDISGKPIVDAFISLAVVVDAKRTKNTDEGPEYSGTYRVIQLVITPDDGTMEKEFKGKITCFGE